MPRPKKIEKSKDFKGSIEKIFKSLKPWRLAITISIILAMISAIISLIAPNKLSDLTDNITEGLKPRISETKIQEIMQDPKIPAEDKQKAIESFGNIDKNSNTKDLLKAMDKLPKTIYNQIKPKMNMQKIERLSLLLAILYIVSSLFGYIQQIIMATVTNHYAKNLRENITNKINKLPLKYFDSHETGDILSRITNDVDSIAQNMNQSLASLVSSVTLFIGSIIMMFITNWIS